MIFRLACLFFLLTFPIAGAASTASAVPDASLANEARKNQPLVIDRRTGNTLVDGILPKGGRGVYSLQLRAGEAFDIIVSSLAVDPLVEIRNERDELLASDDDSGGARDARLRFLSSSTRTETIYVIVRSAQSVPGRFTIELRTLKVRSDIAAQNISLGVAANGRIDSDSLWRNIDGMSIQRFRFDGKAGDRVRISVTPTDGAAPLELQLYAPDGALMAKRTDVEPLIIRTLGEDGKYEVVVAFKPVRSENDANFTVLATTLPPANFVSTPIPLTPGVQVIGSFGPESAVLSMGNARPFVLYTLKGTAGQRFRAKMTMDGPASTKERSAFSGPTLAVGIESPAGFASVETSRPSPLPVRPIEFRFLSDGEMLIRILGSIGQEGRFTLIVDEVRPETLAPADAE